jgi:hypothetical protein|nr:MAG TPA: hypothetical protein [Herelleviridae sp.]DAO46521.1 MAG TPA: hypothetical protein [Caudoviricetes sp.]
MPKWTEYTSKDTLADNDEVMLYDATARANKRGLMSKFWDYVVDKMATAVISKLETNNKTIIGAINALNSESSISLCKVISGENTFSSELKGKSYKAIIGFFYEPSDNPFSFGSGYFIAFQATYLQEASSFVIIGASLTGIIENKFVKLK